MRLILFAATAKIGLALAVWPWASAAPRLPAQALPSWYYWSLLVAFGIAGALLCAGGKGDARARTLGLTFLLFGTLFADRLLSRAASSLEGPFGMRSRGTRSSP